VPKTGQQYILSQNGMLSQEGCFPIAAQSEDGEVDAGHLHQEQGADATKTSSFKDHNQSHEKSHNVISQSSSQVPAVKVKGTRVITSEALLNAALVAGFTLAGKKVLSNEFNSHKLQTTYELHTKPLAFCEYTCAACQNSGWDHGLTFYCDACGTFMSNSGGELTPPNDGRITSHQHSQRAVQIQPQQQPPYRSRTLSVFPPPITRIHSLKEFRMPVHTSPQQVGLKPVLKKPKHNRATEDLSDLSEQQTYKKWDRKTRIRHTQRLHPAGSNPRRGPHWAETASVLPDACNSLQPPEEMDFTSAAIAEV
jgi:hypothetical protein